MGQGAYIFGCQGLILSPEKKRFFRDANPWGFILFARNIDSPDQVQRLTANLRLAVGREAPVLIDQEGGRVQRLRPPHWRDWLPPLEEVALAGAKAGRSMYLRSRIIGAELRSLGIDTNCIPCADIALPDTHDVLRNRCYGQDVATVVRISRAVADGLIDAGVLPVLKHLPGHGRATLDSHLTLPRVSAGDDQLQKTDFAAFKALNDLPLGMSAHIVFEAIDPSGPSTTSRIMTRIIREDIAFDGLLMSDDLSMQALQGSISDRAKAALIAGLDMILHCNGKADEMAKVAAAAGQMHEPAQARADRALLARMPPQDHDIAAMTAEHATLTTGGAQ